MPRFAPAHTHRRVEYSPLAHLNQDRHQYLVRVVLECEHTGLCGDIPKLHSVVVGGTGQQIPVLAVPGEAHDCSSVATLAQLHAILSLALLLLLVGPLATGLGCVCVREGSR